MMERRQLLYSVGRPIARRGAGAMHHPKSAKRFTFIKKWPKNGVFVGGWRGGGLRLKKVHFFLKGGPAPPNNRSQLQA